MSLLLFTAPPSHGPPWIASVAVPSHVFGPRRAVRLHRFGSGTCSENRVVERRGQRCAEEGGGGVNPPVGELAGDDHGSDGPGGVESGAADGSAAQDRGREGGTDGESREGRRRGA